MNRKAKWEIRHAKDRAFERHGLDLTTADLERLAAQIRAGKSRPVRKSTNARSVHLVEHEGSWYPVAYDKTRGQIVTFLP